MMTRTLAFASMLILAGACHPGSESPTSPEAHRLALVLTDAGDASQTEGAATPSLLVRTPAVGGLVVRNVAPVLLSLPSVGEFHFTLPGPAVLACMCPGGRRPLALHGFDGTIALDPAARRGKIQVDAWIQGDWNGDGDVSDLRRSFSGDVQIVLREDEVLGLRASGGAEQISWNLDLSFSRSTGHELKIETLQIAIGPGIFR